MRTARFAALLAVACCWLPAADAPATKPEALKPEVEALIDQAQTWLLAQQQPDGAFMPGDKFTLGITALSVDALCTGPKAIPGDDPRIAKAIDLLLTHQQPDGGIYQPEEGLGNYVTSLTLMALTSAKKGTPEQIKKAQDYLFGLQNVDEASVALGGIGYGSKGEGHEDLSNTGMAVDALRRSGVPANDERLQKAMQFVSRCQNLTSTNDLPWAKAGDSDGGAVYSPEESKAQGSWESPDATKAASENPPTKLESYGSMTYALISSYIALDLKADDQRVKAALEWVKRNYRFDANPGMVPDKARQGLFYYHMLAAKTFGLLAQGPMQLPDGRTVDWRVDLFEAIKAESKPVKLENGQSGVIWINDAERWGENIPHLTAGYQIRALKRIAFAL